MTNNIDMNYNKILNARWLTLGSNENTLSSEGTVELIQ